MTATSPRIAITSLAAGGAGVGRLPDGMTVFVPRTAPGDEVIVASMQRRRRFALGTAAEIAKLGPGRVDPPCPHFTSDRCGGCQWQHLSGNVQRQAKARIVGDALRRIGKLELADPEVVASPRDYGYRATITLTVRHTAARVIAGFHDSEDPSRVFHLDKCYIARAEMDVLWQAIRPSLGALPRGDDVRLKLRVAPDGGLHVIVEGGDKVWGGAAELAAAAKQRQLAPTVWWRPPRGVPRRMAGPEADAGAASFAQVNPDVAELLRSAVVRAVTEGSAERPGGQAVKVLDLYGGVGETAIPLAAAGHDVVMVELDERAVRLADERAAREGIKLRCIAARVEDVLPKLLPADVVIVNPPRAGLSAEVSYHLTTSPPHRLVYVSCDPATLARDLQRVAPGGRLTVRSFDMFPQTSHVETLAVVARDSA
jgi:23S rRNA (uracil1939-C5)-methyltransferase